MKAIKEQIEKNSHEYGSIPFWSWNDRLSPEELRRQIRNMKQMKMGGFFMHARGGLETEYMSDEWYECIRACVDEAKKQGMEAWAYDENGWPSGFAGGRLLEDPDNFAVYVEAFEGEDLPVETDMTLATYFFDDDGVPRITVEAVENCKKYMRIDMGLDGSYVDTMRADVVAKFLESTHEEYKKKLGDDFGSAMPGFFTDEPQYYRWKTPYSRKMEEWFIEEYGYSVLEALPALFCEYKGAKEHRYDYYRLINKKFTDSFSKQVYEWHENNGVKLTGHFIEEQTLAGQMLCCGDIMPQYLYEHIPGIDYLGRRLQTDVASKQLGSVCAQTGKKKALSEMFACCGWDVSPAELKAIAELQYANGVDLMCQHLYPYSIRGQRKRDYPAFYSEHNLWQSGMEEFNRYFNNLGYALSMGEEIADVLLIHPIKTAWLHYRRELHKESVARLDKDLSDLTYLLSGNQIPYHFGSENIMTDMARVHNGRMEVGRCSYGTVIIPSCETLDTNTVKLLRKFYLSGGKLYTYKGSIPTRIDGREVTDGALDFLRECPNICDINEFEELKNEQEIFIQRPAEADLTDLRMMARRTEFGRSVYLTNLSDKELYGIKINVRDCEILSVMNILTLEMNPVCKASRGDKQISIDLMPYESVLLWEAHSDGDIREWTGEPKKLIKLENVPVPCSLPENLMTLDRARVSLNGGAFSELRPLERIRDELLSSRFDGELTLEFPFEIKDIPEALSLICEPMGISRINVNGETVTLSDDWAIDRSFRKADISKYLRTGENSVELSLRYHQRDYVYYVLYGGVSETLRNCLVFDTEIECIYLCGHFRLDMKKEGFISEENNAYRYDPSLGMALEKPKKDMDIRNIVTDGYPFYCGEVGFVTTLNYKKGDPTTLKLSGRYSTARVYVNGKRADSLLFDRYVELGGLLGEGENEIRIELCNNYRNLMGPHHGQIAEPMSVSPKTFSFEGKWNGGKCKEYNDSYAFVRYGIDI